MIKIHHLNESRSQRIVWFLEELGEPYEIIRHQRDAKTRLAPPELETVHPLGKSPVMEDDAVKIAESGAILEYLAATYGDGRFSRVRGDAEWPAYIEWLHYGEGSAMLPLMLNLYVGRLKEAGAPLQPRIDSQIKLHLDYMAGAMEGRRFLVGDTLTAADVQISFVLEVARSFERLRAYPGLSAYLESLHARPAWIAAQEKTGPYALGR